MDWINLFLMEYRFLLWTVFIYFWLVILIPPYKIQIFILLLKLSHPLLHGRWSILMLFNYSDTFLYSQHTEIDGKMTWVADPSTVARCHMRISLSFVNWTKTDSRWIWWYHVSYRDRISSVHTSNHRYGYDKQIGKMIHNSDPALN